MSIALFFLLSGFFLAALLGAVERKRKMMGIAGACVVAIACIIVFLKPVQLPSLKQFWYGTSTTTITLPAGTSTSTTTTSSATGSLPAGTTTTFPRGIATTVPLQPDPAEVTGVR